MNLKSYEDMLIVKYQGDWAYLIKYEAGVVWDHVRQQNTFVSNLENSFEELEKWVGES